MPFALESPLDCEGIHPAHPKGISSECSSEGLMLKLHSLGHLMRRAGSLEETLMLGKIEGSRRGGSRGRDGWVALLTQRA